MTAAPARTPARPRHCQEVLPKKHSVSSRRPQISRTPEKSGRASGWSDERRARHAAAIRRWAPWTKSTGPKTAAGKARAARNALKTATVAATAGRAMKNALRGQARYLTEINRYLALQKISMQNELLNRPLRTLRLRLRRQGARVTADLFVALFYANYVRKSREHALTGCAGGLNRPI